MSALLRELKGVLMPWSPWTDIPNISLCSIKRLYWFLVLPLACLAPFIDLALHLLAPFRSAMMPEMSVLQLAYNTLRDIACGVFSTMVAAKLIRCCAPYAKASSDSLSAHHVAALSISPTLVAIAMRPFAGPNAALIELLAIFYGGYLLSGGISAVLGGDRSKAKNYALVISLNMLLFSYVADWAVIKTQLWVVQFL